MDGYDAEPFNGVTDYTLYRENGEVLAVVEAKKASVDVQLAQAQLEYYVKEIEKHQSFRPFGFLANGVEIYFEDVGVSSGRLVNGFFFRAELENLLFIRQNGKRLNETPINTEIIDRPYQHEAVRRVCEGFERGKRKALIVMATGTGKTRTTMALIDVFLHADQARKILFVADRDVLVDQAKTDGFEAPRQRTLGQVSRGCLRVCWRNLLTVADRRWKTTLYSRISTLCPCSQYDIITA